MKSKKLYGIASSVMFVVLIGFVYFLNYIDFFKEL